MNLTKAPQRNIPKFKILVLISSISIENLSYTNENTFQADRKKIKNILKSEIYSILTVTISIHKSCDPR